MSTTALFYETDFLGTLYPLKTNKLLVENHSAHLSEYIYNRVLNDEHKSDKFLPQQKVFATKPMGHLRRTVKLDPVAEFFIYDFTYRNRAIFRPEVGNFRRSFGYRFENGSRIPVHSAYKAYKASLRNCAKRFKHNLQFDIASYFNSLYHHDVAHWFKSKDGISKKDSSAISQFFREINSGRSIDFMPHGIYPTKMIGNEFLKFVDLNGQLKSDCIVRFMDDFTLFDNDPAVVHADFLRIQQLLGQYSLNVNPSKTSFDSAFGAVEKQLSEIRRSLKKIVTYYDEVESASGVEVIETEREVVRPLDTGQVDALLALLKDQALEESDADIILGFLGENSDRLLEIFPTLMGRFPNLIKHIYAVCSGVVDKNSLASVLLDVLNEKTDWLEYQLFWIAVIVEDFLMGTEQRGTLLNRLFEKTSGMRVAQAKVLEIPEQGFGLKEIRDEYLKTGQSDWLSWASAAGTRSLETAERNHVLKYFQNASQVNHIVASCVRQL